MKRLWPILLLLYLVALHTSMAGMEIFSWSLLAVTLSQLRSRGELAILRVNSTLWIWIGILALAVFLGLVTVEQHKGFWFQFGFMRWVIVLMALTLSLQANWNEKFSSRLVTVWLVCLAVTGAYATLQCLTGWDAVRSDAVLPQGGGIFKAVGFFRISLSFAYVIGISLFAISLPGWRRSKWYYLAITFGVMGLISSMSRGAWLASLFCVFLYFLMTRPKLLFPLGAAVVVLTSGLMLFSSAFSEKIIGMLTLHIDGSSAERLDIWRGYWRMFLDHPLFGVGLLQGDKLLPEIYTRLGIVQDFTSHAHNNFLQFLAGAGILGFVSYCAVSFIFLRKSWRLRQVSVWGWSTFLAQVFFHLGGLTQANFIDAVVNHSLMFTWALVLVLDFRYFHAQEAA